MSARSWLQVLEGVRPVDRALAEVLQRQAPDADPLAVAAAALASLAVGNGHAAFDPAQPAALAPGAVWPDPAQWQQAWHSAPWIAWPDNPLASSDPHTPLVAEFGWLFLRRYRQAEVQLARGLHRLGASRLQAAAPLPERVFAALFDGDADDDRQALAARAALQHPLLLITGGPGTGKTTTIARILLLRIAQCLTSGLTPARIVLAAPTGRAAERMQHSLQQAAAMWAAQGALPEDWLAHLPTRASTVHRLLGWVPGRGPPRHHADHPLPADLVVVDEASMLDLPLMAHLVSALADGTQLILLGDPDQLPSVEAGNVLAALDAVATPPPPTASPTASSGAAPPLHAVHLLRNRRQTGALELQPLADAVRAGDADQALRLLHDRQLQGVAWWPQVDDRVLDHPLLDRCWHAWQRLSMLTDPAEGLQMAAGMRLLTALRHGPYGAAACNAAIEARLAGSRHPVFHPGRLLQISENSPRHDLYNGDTGLCLADADGHLHAWFGQPLAPRALGLAGLPAHDSAYASTVHKAQGSEYDHVWILLPPHDARVLGRELLYTALTRARRTVTLLATPEVLTSCITRSQQRVSGLRQRLR